MKKTTLFLFMLLVYYGYAQPSTAAPTPPTRDAVNVISIFTQTTDANTSIYNDITGTDFNPNWGSTSGNVTYNEYEGDRVLTYPAFNYQGTQLGSSQNISSMEYLHVDIWSNNASPNIYVISSGAEIAHPLTITNTGIWQSFDIPVEGITGDLSNIIQFKFDGGNATTDVIYIDNLYFWKSPTAPEEDSTLSDLQIDGKTINGFGPGTINYTVSIPNGTETIPQITSAITTQTGASTLITQASELPGNATVLVTATDNTTTKTYTVSFIIEGPANAAPTPPERQDTQVKAIYSDSYSNSSVAVNTFDTSWCPGVTTVVDINGNQARKITGLGCEGIEFMTGRFDATEFTHFHIDIYTDSETLDKSFNLKLSNWNGGGSEANAIEYSLNNANLLTTPNPGTWMSLDIPLDEFTAITNADRNDLVQLIFSSDMGTVYYDNIYFHKNTSLSINNIVSTSFNAYPNPTENNWTISTQDILMHTINIYDVLGNKISSISPNNNKTIIDGSNLSKGVYFAQIKTSDGISSIKLIKD